MKETSGPSPSRTRKSPVASRLAADGSDMNVFLGFDPGGEDGFGWCLLQDAPRPPLTIRVAGISNNAETAFAAATSRLPSGSAVVAAGIDSPMFWSPRGDRRADRTVRASVAATGAPSPGGTVQSVNSLRGACITQGVMIASLLRAYRNDLPITEAHPKAYLWTTGSARVGKPAGSIVVASLAEFVADATLSTAEHVRDAALAAFAAWAMIHKIDGWRDLFLDETDPYLPISGPIAFWYPVS